MKRTIGTKHVAEREAHSLPVAATLGFALGAFSGTAALGGELAVLAWLGVGAPTVASVVPALAVYVLLGGLAGAVLGASWLRGGNWLVAWSVCAAGWVFAGWVGSAAVSLGAPGLVGVLPIALLGFVIAQFLGRFGEPGPMQMGLGAGLATTVVVLGALNLHLLPSAASQLAMEVDLLGLLFAAGVGISVGVVSSGDRAPWVQLIAANLAGWGALFPIATADPGPPSTGEEGRPVVLITVEGLRGDLLERDGRAQTPELARLARRSERFEAHATAPWAIPSLASLHSGRLPHHHGAAMNGGHGNAMGPLGARVPTLAQVFAREGYLTGAVVGDAWLDAFGLHKGYRWYSDTPEAGPLPLWLDTIAVALGAPPWPVRRDAATITDEALGFVQAQTGGKWLLWVHYVDAGRPYLGTDADRNAIGDTVRPWPVDDWEASTLALDREIGRLVGGLPRDALVVVAGTHGVQLEEERPARSRVPASAVDGHSQYQELIGVPLWFSGKGVGSARHRRPVSTVDVLPTVLQLRDIEALPNLDGAVLPELGGKRPDTPRPVIAMAVRWGAELEAVRLGDDKVIVSMDGSSPLFDLKADPHEILGKRASAQNEQLERRLVGAAPPMGEGPDLFERASVVEAVGRWLSATLERRRRPSAGQATTSGSEPAAPVP